MATIRKHRGKYQAQVRRRGVPAITKSFQKLSDAKEWAREIERQIDRQELGPDRRELETITLADLIKRYRDTILPKKRGGDFEAIILATFLRHPISSKKLSDLTAADFAAWREERTCRSANKPITQKTAKRFLSPVQRLLQVAMDEWKVPLRENPLTRLHMPVIDNRRERRLREGELARIVEAAKANRNPYILLIVQFAIETAMRRGEIIALKWRDVDMARRTARIRQSKNGYSRTIPLTGKALDIMACLKTNVGSEARVFPTTAMAVRMSWERLLARAGIADLHFHDLRHEAISRLFERGLTVPEVASISGHRDMRMLFRYAHASDASIRSKLARDENRLEALATS